ncbi:uncharacterized protein LOC132793042 [Drosophila nasuta]|uniref:Uncharacterized protein LOC117571528 n=1 Tax=Drosophila albomicans TaxID=7291 RepID=A0A6P8XBV0_DROAB|nr:uncharacterized protein LOC117571528 [Drosophila albomicans]XP_060658618.1 uncharacterized protein LOC132793042 [Drosophila nasuta]
MKSKTLHKSLILLLLMLLLFVFFPPSARCQPLTPPDEPAKQRPFIFIKHNASPEDAKNYQITIEKDPQPGEPCLTISWKTNPDGSGPSDPQIYLSHGYFKIVTASQPKVQ